MIRRATLAALVLVSIGTVAPSQAYTVSYGVADWADFHMFGDDGLDPDRGLIGISLVVHVTGTQYRGGELLPNEGGGLGDGTACMFWHFREGTQDLTARGCLELGQGWEMTRLRKAAVHDFMFLEVRDGEDGAVLGAQGAEVDLEIVAEGLPYPGAGAQSNPSPGATATATVLRRAVVTGTITSQPFGIYDFTGRTATIGHSNCVGAMAGPDHVNACRYFTGNN